MYKEFNKLGIEHRQLYNKYLMKTGGKIPSPLFFSEVMAWDFFNENYFCEIKGYLCILVYLKVHDKVMFLQPLGEYKEDTFREVVDWLYAIVERDQRPLLFLDVSEDMSTKILRQNTYDVIEVEKDSVSDYYYRYTDFLKSLNKKSSLYAYRYFIRHNDPLVLPIDASNKEGCVDITKNYFCSVHKCEECSYGCELSVVQSIIKNYDQMGLSGIIIFGNGVPLGFCMAEVYHKTLVAHFKKSERGLRGINEFIHMEMLKLFREEEIEWVNYTDDMNIPGLRQYKRKLAPYILQPRYVIQLAKRD